MTKIQLDTDLGALAMLLRMEEVEVCGITIVAEASGPRAGYVRQVLELESRADIPVAAGLTPLQSILAR